MVTKRTHENFHFFKYLTLWQCGRQISLPQLLSKRNHRPSKQCVNQNIKTVGSHLKGLMCNYAGTKNIAQVSMKHF